MPPPPAVATDSAWSLLLLVVKGPGTPANDTDEDAYGDLTILVLKQRERYHRPPTSPPNQPFKARTIRQISRPRWEFLVLAAQAVVWLTPRVSGAGLDQCQYAIGQGARGGLKVVVVSLFIRREFDAGMPAHVYLRPFRERLFSQLPELVKE